ncbi:MAG: cytochrome b N-terminal domain-containing protein [Acidobacteriota bacterium]
MFERLTNFLEDRLGLPTLWRSFTDRNIPLGVGWLHVLGSATLFLLLVQAATGVFLAFYYVPSPEHAFQSVSLITNELSFGWLVRGIHKWAASLIVICVVLHMLRVLFMGAYKYPRELTWMVGVLLLLVIMAFAFTGYLLPWDQRAYWATVVGTHIAGYTPVIGPYITEMLSGQAVVGVRTLGRFYAFHTLFLPATLFVLTAIHLSMVVKQGIAAPPVGDFATVSRDEYEEVYERVKSRGHPFYRSMAKDVVTAALLLGILFFLAWHFGAPLEAEANPTTTTYVPRPEWYFYFLYELLWWFPGRSIPVATFWIPLVLVLVLFLLPWMDRSSHRAPLRRPVTTLVTMGVLGMVFFLTYKGATAPHPPVPVSASERQAQSMIMSAQVLQGRTVFEQQGCAACHMVNGQGGVAGPDLTTVGRRHDAAWFKKYIPDPTSLLPGAEMPAYDSLSPQDLDALVAYLQTLR